MKIQKYHFWLLFFFVIFGFTFGMIVWTVKSAVNTPVYEDKSFLSSYHIVDSDFNKMMNSNKKIVQNYDISFDINNHKVPLEVSDIFLGRRSLEKNHKHKDFLKVGKNNIVVHIVDKKTGNSLDNVKIEMLFTKAIEDSSDLDIKSFEYQDKKYHSVVDIPSKGYWNVIAKVTLDNQIGYFFIKTNTEN